MTLKDIRHKTIEHIFMSKNEYADTEKILLKCLFIKNVSNRLKVKPKLSFD